VLLLILAVLAQIPVQTAVDYARAERFMGYNTNPLVQLDEAGPQIQNPKS
jgi:hypothetical protein